MDQFRNQNYKKNRYEPITKRLMDSLYVPQCSPIALLRAVYSGSRSIRGGTWLDFEILGALGACALNGLGGNIGVVEIIGRLSAAGSMSGIVRSRANGGLLSATC
jgi:hypothetical protein